MSMITWLTLLSARKCSYCESRVTPRRGLSRAFCEAHTAELPAPIRLHLDRATRGRWFVAWWRLALRELRTQAVARAKRYNAPRKARGAAA